MDEMTDYRTEEQEAQQAEKLAMMQQGAQLGGLASAQFHWSAANQIRHAAFSSAMDIHRHRTTNHEQIIESAKAFETYLNGD